MNNNSKLTSLGKLATVIVTSFGLSACSSDANFELPGVTSSFSVAGTEVVTKVDVLWVVDSSGSMESSQERLAENFASFINDFQSKKFDYQMAVVSTDAWVDYQGTRHPNHEMSVGLSRFNDAVRDADGKDIIGNTGVHVMTPQTPNLNDVFIGNIKVGVIGNPDERGLQSLVGALENKQNQADGFPRKDAMLAVIFLTDEDDFSHDGELHLQSFNNPYADPELHPVQRYYDYLFDLTDSKEGDLNFIVNSIGIRDQECLSELEVGWVGRRIDRRYAELAGMTGGYQGSLCDDFSDVIGGIADRILEHTSRYSLEREPKLNTIEVFVDSIALSQSNVNGWTYDSESNSIVFHGDAVPRDGQKVLVDFDPATLKSRD